jgi:uncharacterized OB-fold protein
MEPGVLKHGVGYDLVVTKVALARSRSEPHRERLHMGIRCHTCGRTSYQPRDVEERYCGACHKFHDEGPGQIA